MTPYTILLSNFHQYGGGQRVYVSILARNLLRLGHRPLVACPKDSVLAKECRANGVDVLDEFRFDGGFTPVSFSRDIRLAMRVRSENHIDIIHVNGSRDHWVFGTATLLSREKTPIVRTYHNTRPVKRNPLTRFLYRNLTDQVISVCAYVKEMLGESPVFNGGEIAVIHNGIDIEKFTPSPPLAAVRDELGLSADDIIVGMVGRLDWDKGHKYLFDAVAPLVHGEFPQLKIVVVGFGKKHGELLALCRRLDISQNVKFLGPRTDIAQVVSVFDIGAHPSIGIDTSSFAIKEMMAMEKPVVCSTYGGLTEIADDGVTGFLVPPRDSARLRERIVELCRSPELRRHLGKAAREKVEREFTSTVSVQRTLEVYEKTIERFGKSGENRG